MAGGRPKLFKSLEELEERIEEFYAYCEMNKKPLTFERLSTFLKVDRKTIYNYEQRDEFFPCIKAVRDRILADLMEKGMEGQINATFGIFCLKNYGYADKQEVTSTNVNKNVSLEHLSKDELKELLKNES